MAKTSQKRRLSPAVGASDGINMAESADPLTLYQRSVQAPEVDVHFFHRMFLDVFGRVPQRLREDFCGGAAVCCAWVETSEQQEAWGIDLDEDTLAWAKAHNLNQLSADQQSRIHLITGDVRTSASPLADIVCAQNFSYCVFHSRDELRNYFRKCREGLREQGLLVVDLFGGYESLEDDREDITDHEDFYYVWEQHRYDPINARGIYKIHFRFPDDSALEDAFVYDWRLWTIPEVREVMLEAGFAHVDVYWEDENPRTHEGMGTYSRQTSGDSDPAWNAYIVGIHRP